jgi:hypothetical protein
MTKVTARLEIASQFGETSGATAGLPAVIYRNVQALLGKPAVAPVFGTFFLTGS